MNHFETIKQPEKHKINLENWVEVKKGTVFETDDDKPEWERTINVMPETTREKENRETYFSNNGVLSFLDSEGRLFVSPATQERYKELEEAGYKENRGLWVPFSNGEVPADPILKEKWEVLLKERMEKEKVKE